VKRRKTGRIGGGIVLSQTLQKKPVDSIRALAASHDVERLRLALTGARQPAFDWTIADDRIAWDGAVDLLSLHNDPDRLKRGEAFRAWMSDAGRAKLQSVLDQTSPEDFAFEFEFEAASALGSEWIEFSGVRVSGAGGRPERLVGVLRVATEKVREAQRLHYLATRDELTGHLNRTSLREELSHAIEAAKAEQRTCAYLVASIDRLAAINEAYGFGAADEVIVAVGERLAGSLRGSDIIGRTAGNKLGVIVGNCSEREIALVAERLRAAVRNNVIGTRGGTVSATINVGAVCLPGSAASSQEAMLRAEEALDHARGNGRDGFAVYAKSPQRESARLRLMSIADEVVAALHDNRLVFAYQPIVSAKTRAPVHHECLLRMLRKDGTVVSAGQFIPAAEQLGLVRLLDRHALEMTVARLHANPEVVLAVNVSGTTAGDPSWLQSFISYVRANHTVAERIIVELTETAALQDFEESARFVSNLRELGCRLAIDDFGAGYTSFRNLQMLHVDMVKIDGSYVRGLSTSPDNQIFVRTLVDLAKNFNLETVAEWVGSDEDAALLETFGVDYFQGFHFGEPVIAPDWAKD
jgi:diguanylate cyclase (GGDEF)-like protein